KRRDELIAVPSGRQAIPPALVADGEEAEADGAEDAAGTVHREGTARVVDANPLGEVDDQDHDQPGDGTEGDRSGRGHPVARARDGHEASEQAVDRDADVPLL